jgi:hypothetical protein
MYRGGLFHFLGLATISFNPGWAIRPYGDHDLRTA